MNPDRSARALHHLALALAGVCLTLAELPFLPWLPFVLIGYLLLLLLSNSLRGTYVLPAWVANGLALAIAGGGGLLLYHRGDEWAGDVPLSAALVPYLGPVLMALLCVRLFRPRSRDDFWLLQGLGLLQVGLGCVLASGTLFALALLAYLIAAAAALSAGERQRRGRRSAWVSGPAGRAAGWAPFGLRWGLGVGLLAVLLFLLTPRADQPDWDPLSRFGLRDGPARSARTGFSEEIDVNRTGRLTPDDTPAFWVEVRDRAGRPVEALGPATRFRGATLERYDRGVWRSDPGWPGTLALSRRRPEFEDPGPTAVLARFKVPRRAGGLFLVDPVPPTGGPNRLPIREIGDTAASGPIFYETGRVPAPVPDLTLPEFRYEHSFLPDRDLDRVRAPAQRDALLLRLLNAPLGLEPWARALLRRARDSSPELRRAAAGPGELPPMWWARMGHALSDHLARSGEYGYSLETERADESLDPTIDFLWNVKRGPCERYASGLALMLRSQGVPCRVVKGYRGAERDGPGRYVVRQAQAHAWVEALVPADDDPDGYDWLTLDPTPEGGGPLSGLAQWWENQQRGGQEFWNELVVNYNAEQRARVLERLLSPETLFDLLPWLAGAAALAGAVWLARRLARPARPAAVLSAMTLLERLRRRLTAPGRMTPADNLTPGEQAEAARCWLAGRGLGGVADVPAEVVGLYYRARFGGEAADEAELRRAAERLDELERELRSGNSAIDPGVHTPG